MAQLVYAWRLLREIISGHFLIPFALTFIIDTLIGVGIDFDANSLSVYWTEHFPTLLVHSAVFITIYSIYLVRRAGVSVSNIAILDDILPKATFFHAFGMIPLREWFEPSTAAYLGLLLADRSTSKHRIRYKRVLLFLSKTDYLAT